MKGQLMTVKHDRKPCFQGWYTGLLLKSLAAVIAVAMQMAVYADGIPAWAIEAGVPADAVYLTVTDDANSCFSLTPGYAGHKWSDGNPMSSDDADKNYYVPSDMVARTIKEDGTQTVVPNIYCAGRITCTGGSSQTVIYNNLLLLAGGELYSNHICKKLPDNLTVLSKDAENPALLTYNRSSSGTADWKYSFPLSGNVIGSKDSQLAFLLGKSSARAMLKLQKGSNWTRFEGTLRVGDRAGIQSETGAPISTPGSVRFGTDGILFMVANGTPYSFGNLSFVENGSITNTASGATLTVSGTFDTGRNCYWRSSNTGTFGTLIMGDGLTLFDNQEVPTTVLTVTNRLEVGENVTIRLGNVRLASGMEAKKIPVMKLAPEAVENGMPDLSGVKVVFENSTVYQQTYLAVEADPEVEGGMLVCATHDPVVYYNGPSETGKDESGNDVMNGLWLDPGQAPALWEDGLYPDGAKAYVVTQNVYFSSDDGRVLTFPGKTLLCGADLYVEKSCVVTNLMFSDNGRLYVRVSNAHIEGNLTAIDATVIRSFHNSKVYIDSVLHGTGNLTFNSYYPETDKGGGTFYLAADNTDWTGRIETAWSQSKDYACPVGIDHHTRIVVGDAKALGGDCESFTYNAQVLKDFAEFWFTDTTIQTAANRGWLVTNGIVRVDQGATVDLKAPVTLAGTLRKKGAGVLGLFGGIRWAANNDLADATGPESEKNVVLVEEGAIKGSSLAGAAVTFSSGTGIVADGNFGALDLSGATVAAEGETIYLTADGNNLSEPEQAVTYPVVKVSAAQAATLGAKFKAKKSPWQGWPVTVVTGTDESGSVTYSVKYEKKGFVFSIR